MSITLTRSAGVLGTLNCPLGFGLLRLGIADRPSEAEAIDLIHFAFDRGVRLLDTADTYCLDDKDLHYGERLARKAVDSWKGPSEEVRIITKIGMERPKGKWRPNGSPRHLPRAVDGCLEALGVERLFLVQLHAKDSRVPFEETLGALAELQMAGKIEHIGLCNVGPAEVRQAMRHFSVVSVQNELGILSQATAKAGMLEFTKDLGIPFLAHRPLGGYAKVEKLLKNRVLKPLVARHGVPPHEIALAALLKASDHIIPLIGATRRESLEASFKALERELDSEDWERITSKYSFQGTPEALAANAPRVTPKDLPTLEPDVGPGTTPEVVLLMGIQGAGKSELVAAYEEAGYARLNRDEAGGKLDDLIDPLKEMLDQGQKRVVLDNTYPTRVSREPVITAAHAHGIPVRCRYLATSMADARINVVSRILNRYDKLLGPDEMKELAKVDPNLPPPIAMQRWMNSFEPPAMDEGFSAVDEIPFVRRPEPEWTNKGLLLDVDGTIRITKSGEIYPRQADDVQLLPGRREVLQKWIDVGYSLFFISNQSGVASNHLSEEDAQSCFARTVELLGLPIQEICFCPHRAFPVVCFCRKPMPGMGIDLMRRYKLSPEHLVMVGDMDSDAAFASGLSARYYDAEEFFSDGGPRP
jgi:histidinol-phosphate phosphatase family protein